ncbi:hypothetical protein DESC_190050 [Desulfosarcina cetonica]|nr:hypothetical protein DESC_190050 [Desulfosarcina cetonica]
MIDINPMTGGRKENAQGGSIQLHSDSASSLWQKDKTNCQGDRTFKKYNQKGAAGRISGLQTQGRTTVSGSGSLSEHHRSMAEGG